MSALRRSRRTTAVAPISVLSDSMRCGIPMSSFHIGVRPTITRSAAARKRRPLQRAVRRSLSRGRHPSIISSIPHNPPSVRSFSDPPPDSLTEVAVAFDDRDRLYDAVRSLAVGHGSDPNYAKARTLPDGTTNGGDVGRAQFQGRTYAITPGVLPWWARVLGRLRRRRNSTGQRTHDCKQKDRSGHQRETTGIAGSSRSVERHAVQRQRRTAMFAQDAWTGNADPRERRAPRPPLSDCNGRFGS